MKFALATLVPAALALSAMGHPVELDVRQQCNLAACIRVINSQIPGFISPCERAGTYLLAIEESESQGQQPSQSDQFGFVADGAQCIALTIAAGFAIPNSCLGCPGTPGN